MTKKKCKYMHTLNGQPAQFDGEQICFADKRIKLADSSVQIRREEQLSRRWRLQNGYENEWKESYVTIDIPDQPL